MSKKIKVIFTISVLMNVFLAGLVAGNYSKDFKHEVRSRTELDTRLTEFISILPEEERPRFKSDMESLVKNNEQARKQMRTIRREMMTIFETEPFDTEQYYKKTQEIHILRGAQMVESSKIVGELSTYLPKEQRVLLASRLVRGQKRLSRAMEKNLVKHQ